MLRASAPTDRVALVLENGPEAATAFLGIASAASARRSTPRTAPASSSSSWATSTPSGLVVVGATSRPPLGTWPGTLDIRVLELARGPVVARGARSDWTGVPPPWIASRAGTRRTTRSSLHTSGTTGRPKVVPLAHRHLLASARNVAATLRLGPDDRCLNVMPLFHIHGLVAALLASLAEQVAPSRVRPVSTSTGSSNGFQLDPDVDDRGADHAPGPSRARSPGAGSGRGSPAPLRSLVVCRAHPRSSQASRSCCAPGGRGIRHDRGGSPDGEQPAAAGHSEAGLGGSPGRAGDRDPRFRRTTWRTASVGEVAISGRERLRRLRVERGCECRCVHGRLVPDRRRGATRRGRVSRPPRAAEGNHQSCRREGVAARGRRSPPPASPSQKPLPSPCRTSVSARRLRPRSSFAPTLAGPPRDLQDFVAQTVAPFKVPGRHPGLDEIPKGPTGKLQRVGLAGRLELSSDSWRSEAREAHARGGDRTSGRRARDPRGRPRGRLLRLGGDSILGAEAVARVRELVGRPELPLVASSVRRLRARWRTELEGEFGWAGRGGSPPSSRRCRATTLPRARRRRGVRTVRWPRSYTRRHRPVYAFPGSRRPTPASVRSRAVRGASPSSLPRGHAPAVQPSGSVSPRRALHGRDGRARALETALRAGRGVLPPPRRPTSRPSDWCQVHGLARTTPSTKQTACRRHRPTVETAHAAGRHGTEARARPRCAGARARELHLRTDERSVCDHTLVRLCSLRDSGLVPLWAPPYHRLRGSRRWHPRRALPTADGSSDGGGHATCARSPRAGVSPDGASGRRHPPRGLSAGT